ADSFSTAIFKGACSVLEAAYYIPVMLDTNSDQNTENKLINAVGLGTYDGLILQPLSSDVPTIQAEVRRQMPIVTLDRQLDYSPWPQVIINNFTSSQKAAQYFKSEHYQQILILSAPVAIASTRQERLQGIKSIYPQASLIEIDERHIKHEQVQHQIISFLQKQHQKT
ncbi:hypothetical protein EQ500_12915, partial [Lactobacillus sp. XV13L]|nr:hypothetical protein [Lactobacillus sp. XV13L]